MFIEMYDFDYLYRSFLFYYIFFLDLLVELIRKDCNR